MHIRYPQCPTAGTKFLAPSISTQSVSRRMRVGKCLQKHSKGIDSQKAIAQHFVAQALISQREKYDSKEAFDEIEGITLDR